MGLFSAISLLFPKEFHEIDGYGPKDVAFLLDVAFAKDISLFDFLMGR